MKPNPGRWPLAAAGSLAGLSLALVLALISLSVVLGDRFPLSEDGYRPFNVGVALGFSAAGLAVVRRQPGNLVGWMLLAGALGNAAFGAGLTYAVYARYHPAPGAMLVLALALGSWVPLPVAFALTLAIFPDGRPLGPRWRLLPPLILAGGLAWLVGAHMLPFSATSPVPALGSLRNPIRLGIGDGLASAGQFVVVAGAAAAAVSLVLRFRRARGVERQQLKWLGLAAVPLAGTFVTFLISTNPLWSAAGVVLFAVPIVVAILRYRLYDLDLVVSRALLYGLLSAAVAGVYLGLVAAGALFAAGGLGLRVAATVVAALVALLVSGRLLRLVERLVYGRRRQPLKVVGGLGRRLEAAGTPEEVLRGAADELAAALKLAGLEVIAGGRVLATAGVVAGEPLRLPLIHSGAEVGTLAVAPARGDSLSPDDLRLLDGLRPQLAVAVHALELTAELRRSRDELVAAREEERRRIRNDLHDGVGPALTGIAMQADAALNLLAADPARAGELLAQLRGDLGQAIDEIRRLVYGLRPPALDELGLAGALRREASRFRGGPRVDVDANGLPELPAAVEVAAFRIAAEAVNNAVRHSAASRCSVRLRAGDELQVEVVDDGSGWPETLRPGLGIRSMRERAEEVGGRLEVDGAPGGGARVLAHLPLRAARA